MAAGSKTPRASSSRFSPITLVGPPGSALDRLRVALSAQLDQPATAIAAEKLTGALHPPGRIGVLFLVADGAAEDPHGASLVATLAAARLADAALPIVVAGDGLPPQAVSAVLRAGANDVVFTAGDAVDLPPAVASWIARRAAREQGLLFEASSGAPRIIGPSPAMQEVGRLVERVAPTEATVLILGESGTGKELIARAIHDLSPRSRGPFIAINCAAIPETLLENELFGHEKGSYTGASSTAIGKVEAAEKGTLFLDEIGEMPIQLQSKLLRLLQDHTFDRIGGSRTRKADVRIVAATNRELKAEVAAKRFREDLYYRLSVVPVFLSALRDRREDIPLIAQAVAERLARDLGRPGLHLTPAALERMISHRWPGNVRELENELERASVFAAGDQIDATDLELRSRIEDPDRLSLSRFVPLGVPLVESLAAAEREVARLCISVALEQAHGDRAQAAAQLGITLEELERRFAD